MGSVLRHICPVLAIAVAAGAMDIASAQQIGSASPDIRTGIYRGRSVTYEIIDGLAVWDGDIILGTPEELDIPGKALVSVNNNEMLWPGGIIPYVIDPELINPHVPNAIQHWNENTVIRLVERTNQPNWFRFVPGNICGASVGMKGGEQKVWLSESCSMHGVLHEIGHIVGLWHEHQRNDRDRYIWVAPEDALGNYDHMSSRGLNSGPYDYGFGHALRLLEDDSIWHIDRNEGKTLRRGYRRRQPTLWENPNLDNHHDESSGPRDQG